MNIETFYNKFIHNNILSIDSRKISKNCIFFAIQGTKFNGNQFALEAISKGAAFAFVDDIKYLNTDKNIFYIKDTVALIQKLARYRIKNIIHAKVIGITGSNGKTTTKDLLINVLSKNFKSYGTSKNLNNHIGVPLTILSIPIDAEIVVIEMGASQKKDIELLCSIVQPDYGYITSFGQAHIKGFCNFDGVISGKLELYEYLKLYNKIVFINRDDIIQVKNSVNILRYGFSQNINNKNHNIIYIKTKIDLHQKLKIYFKNRIITPQLFGQYNFPNISAAITIGNYFGINPDNIKMAIESYIPNNRSQIINKSHIKIILDAYNANYSSMKASIQNFNKIIGFKIAIIGDMFELGYFEHQYHKKIVDLILKTQIHFTYLVGYNFSKILIKNNHRIFQFNNKNNLKKFLYHHPIKNGIILIKGSRKMELETIVNIL